MSKWWSHQQTNYKTKKNSMKDKTRYNLYTQFLEDYKEYFIPTHEKWFNNFDKLKIFITKNKKIPSAKSKNENEQFIGSWLDVQKKL